MVCVVNVALKLGEIVCYVIPGNKSALWEAEQDQENV